MDNPLRGLRVRIADAGAADGAAGRLVAERHDVWAWRTGDVFGRRPQARANTNAERTLGGRRYRRQECSCTRGRSVYTRA